MNDGFWKWIEERSKIQFYAVFIFIWISLHWKVWTILFFVSEEEILAKYHLLKVDYITGYANIFLPHGLLGLGDEIIYWINLLLCLIVAGLIAYLCVWHLPSWVLLPAYKKEREHEFNKQKENLKFEKQLLKLKEQNVEREKDIVISQVEVASKKEEVDKSQSTGWRREYLSFKKNNTFQLFEELIESLYVHSGEVSVYDQYANSYTFQLDKDLLAYADSNNLVEYDRRSGTIELTEKGKYFVTQYQENK